MSQEEQTSAPRTAAAAGNALGAAGNTAASTVRSIAINAARGAAALGAAETTDNIFIIPPR
jgi:hypothetical protein